LRTVYQTLNDLAAMGEIQAIDLGTGSIRFDPHPGPHHHLVCDEGGRGQDVEAELPGVTGPDADAPGFGARSPEIIVRRRCQACAEPDGGAHTQEPAATTTTEDPPSQEAIRA